jgi:hypothetical protein
VHEQVTVPARRPAPADEPGPAGLSLERARWELAAMAGRLRTLDRELTVTRRQNVLLTRELARERQHARALRQSDTYRLGKAAVELVRHPLSTAPRLARAVLRRLKRGELRSRRTNTAVATRRPAAPTAPQRPPVHLYVAIGLDAETLRTFVRTLNQRLLVNADHSPVVVTDCPTFALLRKLGVVLEYLPDRHTWQRHRPDVSWDDVLSERLSRLYRDHASVRTVIVDRLHPPTLAELLR